MHYISQIINTYIKKKKNNYILLRTFMLYINNNKIH